MKKLLAMAMAFCMVFSMAACSEKSSDDDKDDTKDSSVVADDGSSEEDSSKEDSSKEDEPSSEEDSSKEEDSSSEPDSSEPDSSEDDSSSEDPGDGDTITYENLSMKLGEGWTATEYQGVTTYIPPAGLTDGSNMNILTTAKDSMFSLYTKEIFEQQLASQFGSDFSIDEFESVNVGGKNAYKISYTYSSIPITQYMIDAEKSYILTFTGASFDNLDQIIGTITFAE